MNNEDQDTFGMHKATSGGELAPDPRPPAGEGGNHGRAHTLRDRCYHDEPSSNVRRAVAPPSFSQSADSRACGLVGGNRRMRLDGVLRDSFARLSIRRTLAVASTDKYDRTVAPSSSRASSRANRARTLAAGTPERSLSELIAR